MTDIDGLLARADNYVDIGNQLSTGFRTAAVVLMADLAAALRALRDRMDKEIALAREDGWNQRAIGDVVRTLRDQPDDDLVDLLVERGVLEPVTLPHGNHTISVYQRKDT